ncbi:hypothetical protein [Enterococcus sp.]|uniref:hypothetical protein n=1 Tax=Enterococcus sp. TaxID=35783 RepID=UPI0028ACC69B|nr:hypothetical protein [Enterococcus sp.]
MNILLIGPDPAAKGGIATVIHNFQKAQAPEDVRFIIHTTWSEKGKYWTQFKAFLTFRRHIKKERCQDPSFPRRAKGQFLSQEFAVVASTKTLQDDFSYACFAI